MMHGAESKQKQEYRKFVESGLAKTDKEFLEILKASPLSIGGDEFTAKVRDMHFDLASRHARPEDIAFRKIKQPLKADEVIREVCGVLGIEADEMNHQRRDSLVRPLIAKMLCKHAGLSQREIADRMGLKSGATVSHQLRKLESEAEKSKKVRVQLKALDAALSDI
jgi:chromosomal replication initiation ATPase DnaA